MSSHSYSDTCPNCGGDMNMVDSNQPYRAISGECLNCGFSFYPQEQQLTLEEVNDQRADMELEPLTELAKRENFVLPAVYTADGARELAQDWQQWASEQNLSYGEMSYYQDYFAVLGRRYDLTEEFKENAII